MEMLGGLGVILILFLVILGILWILLPFAVFGIKDRLDSLSNQLKEMTTQLQRMSVLLDPDDEKSRLHAEYVGRQEAAQRAEAARLQRQKEMQEAEERRRKDAEELAEKDRTKEEKKLSKSQASLNCPSCNRPVNIKDLRTGSKHRCPHCNQVFEIS